MKRKLTAQEEGGGKPTQTEMSVVMHGSGWIPPDLSDVEGNLKHCPGFVQRDTAIEDSEQDQRHQGCVLGSNWGLRRDWD